MMLDIRTIPAGHSSVSRTADLDVFKTDLPPISGKIPCDAEIDRLEQQIHVHLRFKAVLALECSRCMGTFAYPVDGDLRLVVKEQPGRFGPSSDDETVDFYFDSRHLEVDLGPAIYEEIMTALPMKPLCSEECKGIVISAGGGTEKEIDPRWEALRNLKNSQKN